MITRSLTNEFEPEDITDRYKNPAEPPEERDTLNNRLKNDVNYEILLSEENRVRFLLSSSHGKHISFHFSIVRRSY